MELYIHIPFCRKKCAYCAFASFPGREDSFEAYIEALIQEAAGRSDVSEPLSTVYFGGGTPSLLPPALLSRLFSGMQASLDLSAVTECTVEANPGTVTEEWLETAVACGVNRISFGMQAYQRRLLEILGRIHRFDAVEESVRLARRAGIGNINLDLMFGIPEQTREDWRETLSAALSLRPDHISAYGLIPEEGTSLERDLTSGRLSLPEPEAERAMYDDAIRELERAGLAQYELSNFARPGKQCRHNIGYWDMTPYLGLGVSAASMFRLPDSAPSFSLRTTNPDTLEEYLAMVRSAGHDAGQEKEWISRREARFESVMLSLRMTEGLDRSRFRSLHGADPEAFFPQTFSKMEKSGLLVRKGDFWRLSRRGMDIQNSILVEFMEEAE